MIIEFTPEMLQEEEERGKVLQPGWYKATCIKMSVAPDKSGTGTNYIAEFKFDSGKIIKNWFNTKATGFWLEAIAAYKNMTKNDLIAQYKASQKAGKNPDLEQEIMGLEGKTLKVKVGVSEYDRKINNNCEAYAGIDAQVK